jgi:hypothetical protein
MMRLHLKKQICMEGGCMQNEIKNTSVDLMDWIPELITLVLFGVGIMVLIGFVIYAVYMYYWGVWND